jgi:hypothetical protein
VVNRTIVVALVLAAMTYLYRVARQGVSEPEAREDLDAIWTPEGTWERYMDEILETEEKH